MKFTEALQKCYENPGLVFIKKSQNEEVKMRYGSTHSIQFKVGSRCWNCNIYICGSDLTTDWELEMLEVDCEHAILAWLIKNRKIKCILPDDRVNEYIRKEVVITPSNNDLVHFRTYAKYGKWYILED